MKHLMLVTINELQEAIRLDEDPISKVGGDKTFPGSSPGASA
jgi:hypothetical protein